MKNLPILILESIRKSKSDDVQRDNNELEKFTNLDSKTKKQLNDHAQNVNNYKAIQNALETVKKENLTLKSVDTTGSDEDNYVSNAAPQAILDVFKPLKSDIDNYNKSLDELLKNSQIKSKLDKIQKITNSNKRARSNVRATIESISQSATLRLICNSLINIVRQEKQKEKREFYAKFNKIKNQK